MRPNRAELLLVVLLSALPAQAKEVARDERGGVLEVSGFYKSVLSGFLLQPDALAGSRVFASLLAPTTTVPEGGLLSSHLFRVSSRFRFEDKIELDVAWQLALQLASDPAFVGGTALSVGRTGSGAQRRVLELAGPLAGGPSWRLEHNLDRLALKLALPFGDLTIGRQVLSWGTGRIWNPTVLMAEYAYNGFGTTDPRKYAAILSSARVIRGEIFGAGAHQAALAASFLASNLVSIQLSVLGNLTDPSAMLIPSLEYSFTQTVLVRAGAYVPLGRGPDPHAYDALTPADVATNSDALRSATTTRGLRSEYGGSSFGAFLQVGIYVP